MSLINPESAGLLNALWQQGIAAVSGQRQVERWLDARPEQTFSHVVAIGKAASAMMLGAMKSLELRSELPIAGLVITKAGLVEPGLAEFQQVKCVESAHPIPDQRSLDAGQALLDFIAVAPEQARVLVLISGGGSALVEVLQTGVTLAHWQAFNQWALSRSLSIHTINALRKRLSRIKAGGLLALLGKRSVTGLVMSDVPGNDLATVASGLLSPTETPLDDSVIASLPIELAALFNQHSQPAIVAAERVVDLHLIGSNQQALRAISKVAIEAGQQVSCFEDGLSDELNRVAKKITVILKQATPGIYLWGGEPVLDLPESPGQGGRAQQLALALAIRLQGEAVSLLVAGTDGDDGTTRDSGAMVDGNSYAQARALGIKPESYLQAANSAEFHRRLGTVFTTGVTGTNVNDLLIAVKE